MARRNLFRCLSIVLLGLCSYWSVRLARPATEDRTDTENPDLYMEIGQQAEFAGDLARAETSLLRAAEISRIYQPRYLLTQFYFRHPQNGQFWKWWRAAMNTAYGDVAPLLDLAWHTRPECEWLWAQALPQRTGIARQYLGFLEEQSERTCADTIARWLAVHGEVADRQALLIWMDKRIEGRDLAAAGTVWNEMCHRGLLPYPGDDPLTNGDFARTPLATGFDWRITGTPGVSTTIGGGRMRMSFTGDQPEDCTLVWQPINADPATHFRVNQEVIGDGLSWTIEKGRLLLVYHRPLGSTRRNDTITLSPPRLEKVP